MSPRRRKILSYLAMFFSADVLVAAVLGIIFMWVAFGSANNLLTSLFTAGQKATATAEKALTQIDNAMVDFGNKAAALSSDVAQVGQNVADQGVIKSLLSPEKEALLTEKVTEVKQTMAQLKDAIDSVRNFMNALQSLPFIQVPKLDDSVLSKIDGIVQQVEDLVKTVQEGITGLRTGVVNTIDKVSQALASLSTAVFEARYPLAEVRSYVTSANQVILPFLSSFTPVVFLLVGVVLTLMYGWTIFVMYKFIRWANAWRKGASPTLVPNTVPTGENKPAPKA